MEKQILSRVIVRCAKSDILDVCRKWNFLTDEALAEINMKKPKIRIAEDIYEVCKDENLDLKSVGQLDLIYSQINSSSRKWNVLELRGQDESHYISNPDEFRKLLISNLRLQFDKVYVNVNMFSGAVWSRIQIVDVKNPHQYKPNDVVYMVHYPKTQFVILSRVKTKDEHDLLETLLSVFMCEDIHAQQLIGKHISSLVELALNKHSQGSFGKYRDIELRDNPLARRNQKKRKASSDEPSKETDSRLRCENEDKKRQRLETLDKTLGEKEQPTLEKLEYKMEVKFRAAKHAPAMANLSKPFRCRIKFEGPSVLEGIRSLGKAGIATVPLPSHLSRVNSLAKNFFLIRDKTSAEKSH